MKKEQMNVALDPALKAKVRGMYKSDNCSTMTEYRNGQGFGQV